MELNYNCVNDIIRYLRDNLRPHAQIELDEIIQSLKKYSYDDYLTCSQYLKQCGYVDAQIALDCYVDDYPKFDIVVFNCITPKGYELLEMLSDNEFFNKINRKADIISNSGVVSLAIKILTVTSKSIHR